MSIFNKLILLVARFGNVGGTARIGANTYKFLQQTQPHLTHDEILYTIIEYRYKDRVRDKTLIYKHLESVKKNSGELGLDSVITTILMLEAGYAENSSHNRALFKKVIDEELLRKGLSKSIVYGKSRGGLMDSLNIDVISGQAIVNQVTKNPLEAFVNSTTLLLESNDEINRHINALYSAHNQENIANVVTSIINDGYDLESFVQFINERTDRDTMKELEGKLLSVRKFQT